MMNLKPFCIGFNCALGAEQMKAFVGRLSKISHIYVHAYPNAGLPNAMGGYDETAEHFAMNAKDFCTSGYVNMIGGCCGTTPNFINALWNAVKDVPRREVSKKCDKMMLSGMQEFIMEDNIKFINIGERCNISGSLKFKRLIKND